MKYVQYIIFAIILIILIGFTIVRKKTTINENSKILMNPGYAIGVVVDYHGSTVKSSPSINFHFYIEGKKYLVGNGLWKGVPKTGIRVGSKYLVLYLKEDPEKCFMIYDKPIRDSTDYNKYLEEIANGKPIEFKSKNK